MEMNCGSSQYCLGQGYDFLGVDATADMITLIDSQKHDDGEPFSDMRWSLSCRFREAWSTHRSRERT